MICCIDLTEKSYKVSACFVAYQMNIQETPEIQDLDQKSMMFKNRRDILEDLFNN